MDAQAKDAKTRRRKRRTRDDVAGLIREAARQLFAERGYAATTTKEIARLADVSETLLFRYYGGKAALFDEVVSNPFNELMREFIAGQVDGPLGRVRAEDARRFTARVYELFESNRQLFAALLVGPRLPGEEGGPPPLHGLDGYFEASVAELNRQYAAAGREPGFDLAVGVRLGFGMIAASVLLGDWLFPAAPPSSAAAAQALEQMVERALSPPRGSD
jgi:AcrR family transcriptional regulator